MNVRGSYLPSEKGGQQNERMVIRNEWFPAYKTSIKKGSEKRKMIASQFKWTQDTREIKCDEGQQSCDVNNITSKDRLPEFTKVMRESIRPPRMITKSDCGRKSQIIILLNKPFSKKTIC